MDTPLSIDLRCEALPTRVAEVLRRHRVRPHPAEPLARPSSPSPLPPKGREGKGEGSVEDIARAALDTLLTRQFRVGPLPAADLYEQFLAPVRRFVRKGKPIKITVGYGPLKNPNAVTHRRAD